MALLLKDGLIQIRLPQADVDRFRRLAEEVFKTTASEVLRRWIYQAMDEEEKRLVRVSRANALRVLPPSQPLPGEPLPGELNPEYVHPLTAHRVAQDKRADARAQTENRKQRRLREAWERKNKGGKT